MPNSQETPAPPKPVSGGEKGTALEGGAKDDRYAFVIPLGSLKDFLVKPIPATPPLPHPPKKWSLNKLADRITLSLGSTESLLVHTAVFIVAFAFVYAGFAIDSILLILTTIVSLEAIYLAIFIQRTANKQTERMEKLIREIRQNTVIHLEQPLDQVVGQIHKDVRRLHRMYEKDSDRLPSAST